MGSDSSDLTVAAPSALACMSRSHLDCAVWPQKLPLILHTNGTSNKIEFRLSNDRPRCLSLPTAEYACCCLIIATACLRRLQLSAVAKRHCVYVDATPVTPSTQKCLQFSLAALSRQRRCLSLLHRLSSYNTQTLSKCISSRRSSSPHPSSPFQLSTAIYTFDRSPSDKGAHNTSQLVPSESDLLLKISKILIEHDEEILFLIH